NAREWCSDWFDANTYDATSQINPTGPSSGLRRVFRGGGWSSSVECCRAAFRGGLEPTGRFYDCGFRLVLSR
ncbi:MAG: SUMF1/EgtB/PvdO family nonheme iron enzyme, partial [Thermoguttaceae bacterium]|nr:SUMF1/EgtB/PvdO family nonheme iron enzyme [Thermoguttaceae bacterium]